MMNEYPILFKDAMVRAILDGRKTQTRRPLRVQPDPEYAFNWRRWVISDQYASEPQYEGNRPLWVCGPADGMCEQFACRYGEPGDRLWVKETFGTGRRGLQFRDCYEGVWYYADGEPNFSTGPHWKKYSSMFMPRWASRITLEVVNVRVQRVQDISEEDAGEETGAIFWGTRSRTRIFKDLWDSINANRGFGWDVNPWVWVIEFKRLERETPVIAQ